MGNLRRYVPDDRDKPGLFDPATHAYEKNGLPLISVTQVLGECHLTNLDQIPPWGLERGRERGVYVHQGLHAYLEDDFDLCDCDPRFRGYIDSALKYLAELKKTPLRDDDGNAISVEWRFWDVERRFAGTVDYVGWDPDGTLSIDDWKTGDPDDVSAPIQLAAYEYGVRKHLVPRLRPKYTGPIRRRAVKLFADGRIARAEPYDDPRDLQVFFGALAVCHFRRNNLSHFGVAS